MTCRYSSRFSQRLKQLTVEAEQAAREESRQLRLAVAVGDRVDDSGWTLVTTGDDCRLPTAAATSCWYHALTSEYYWGDDPPPNPVRLALTARTRSSATAIRILGLSPGVDGKHSFGEAFSGRQECLKVGISASVIRRQMFRENGQKALRTYVQDTAYLLDLT